MFYIIERKEQLECLPNLDNCFIRFISFNDNFHPALNNLTLIYLRGVTDYKGYILCLKHNESLSLNRQDIFNYLNSRTKKLWVLNKKEAMYYYPNWGKLFDINFIQHIEINNKTECYKFYYNKYSNLYNINCLIPISKHYEECENIFQLIKPIINSYKENNIYEFNNTKLTEVFYNIESNGIKIDKQNFIKYYGENLKSPEFNISKGKIYSYYNLYTLTGRPSNTFNSINFAALNKINGERQCYCPSNNLLVEIDFKGYHPRLIGELVEYPLEVDNIYEYLNIEKTIMFENLYGGIRKEYINKPYFKEVNIFINKIWEEYKNNKTFSTVLRIFKTQEINNKTKLFNYIIQGLETYNNVNIIYNIFNILKNKKTKIILYTYDSILLDLNKEDGKEILEQIEKNMKYPVSIKTGKNYHELKHLK
jgi:hypothetical protein